MSFLTKESFYFRLSVNPHFKEKKTIVFIKLKREDTSYYFAST